ncbi:MAG: hypothetical protein PHI97_13855 [Desulfobulbus sp.]|nr:hypothetical protein [Desulfobulbus sp.]
MKPFIRPNPLLFFLLSALLFSPLALRANEDVKQPAATSPEDKVEQPANPTAQSAEELQALRQRYGQDPTGARARLGMCRRGYGGGHGNGRGGGRGGGRGMGPGAMRGAHSPCPYGEQQWNKQP